MKLESTVIKASKIKLMILIVLGVAFVALGIWLLTLDTTEIEANRSFNNPLLAFGVGITCIVLFGFCTVASTRRLFSSKPGLELNSNGIKIYSAGSSSYVLWQDCSGFSTYEIHKQKMLVINLNEPKKYIEQESPFRKKLAQASYNLCGSPVAISAGTLQVSFAQLTELCEKYFQAYTKNT